MFTFYKHPIKKNDVNVHIKCYSHEPSNLYITAHNYEYK